MEIEVADKRGQHKSSAVGAWRRRSQERFTAVTTCRFGRLVGAEGLTRVQAVGRPQRLKSCAQKVVGMKKRSFGAFYRVNLASTCQTRTSLLCGPLQMFF